MGVVLDGWMDGWMDWRQQLLPTETETRIQKGRRAVSSPNIIFYVELLN
jgi:hypothetical protein